MKVLVTGAAGFIGFHLVRALLQQGCDVIGLDNINAYYDTRLKYARLNETGIEQEKILDEKEVISSVYPNYSFIKQDLSDRISLSRLFDHHTFDLVINLAGQAGVRYSIENPYTYIESNVVGFLNILENCRWHGVKRLIYASSSSVYGLNSEIPYSENAKTDSPISIYAATKKTNELMAHVYSQLYQIQTIGMRFFTVYGPWGRPDMAPFLFLRSILHGKTIQVYNHGDMSRDFTYIDDIINGVMSFVFPDTEKQPLYQLYNIGHSSPVKLMDFISVLEKVTNHKASMKMLGMQPGDVYCTYADTRRLQLETGYKPSVEIEDGIKRFYDWYKAFYKE